MMNSTAPIPEELRAILPAKIHQISRDALDILLKAARQEQLNTQELEELFNPTEAAALLSVLYRRSINPRYVKELTRDFVNKETGHVTPARLPVGRVAGQTNLYKVKHILTVKLRDSHT